jgi:hypothetical protein
VKTLRRGALRAVPAHASGVSQVDRWGSFK